MPLTRLPVPRGESILSSPPPALSWLICALRVTCFTAMAVKVLVPHVQLSGAIISSSLDRSSRMVVSSANSLLSAAWRGVGASAGVSAAPTYTLGREIGPAQVSVSVGHSTLDYEQYWVLLPVAGGRTDESWFGGVTAAFNDYSYMGFVPVVSVNAEKSRPNISRFDVDQTAVSFGIRSEF